MVTQITLGSFFSANGRNVLGGVGGSGLNTQALIESLVLAKSTPAILLQQQIEEENGVIAALNEFQQLVANFQSIANSLRNPPGVANAADNAFSYRSVSLSSDTSDVASEYFTVSASPGTTLQTYSVSEITSIAAATKQVTDSFMIADANTAGLVVASGATAGQFNAGTFTVNGAEITLDTTDTLNSIAQKFNNVANQSGVLATVVKVEDGEFILSFTGLETGTEFDFDLEDTVGTVSDPDGVISQIVFTTNQTAADAVFKLDGVEITRSTNTITDLVDGLTFNILQETPTGTPPTFTVDVDADTTTPRNSIIALADAYNALKVFAAEQQATNADGTYASTAILATNQTFRTTMDVITSQISSVVSGLPDGDPSSLADIGITFTTSPATATTPEVRNVLTIDDDILTAALASDFNEVRDLFQFTLTSSNVNLQIFSRTNALGISDFTLDVNPFAEQVTQEITVADADTQIAFTTPSEGQFGVGDIIINGETISIIDGDTLNTIESKFNAVSANSGVTASVVEVETGVFTITFTAIPQAGEANLFDLSSDDVDADGVFDNIELTATGTYTATYDLGEGAVEIELDGSAITGGGGFLLTGQDGTVLEGLQLIYGNQAAAIDIDVTVTQGIGDLLYNTSDAATDGVEGTVAIEIASIEDSNDRLEDQIENINEQVEQFREFLLVKFAALEQAISQVNLLLASLDAQDQARRQAAG